VCWVSCGAARGWQHLILLPFSQCTPQGPAKAAAPKAAPAAAPKKAPVANKRVLTSQGSSDTPAPVSAAKKVKTAEGPVGACPFVRCRPSHACSILPTPARTGMSWSPPPPLTLVLTPVYPCACVMGGLQRVVAVGQPVPHPPPPPPRRSQPPPPPVQRRPGLLQKSRQNRWATRKMVRVCLCLCV
jgi:hypothetical protein